MQPFLNDTQAIFPTSDVADEVNQLFASVAFSSLTEPAPHTITTWADQGTGTYPLTNNRGATESTNVSIEPNTGEVGGVDKIEFVPNSTPVGLHEDLVSGDLYYNAINLSAGGGSGDVVGPASATDDALVRYDGATGKLIQDSLVTMDDLGSLAGVAGINFQPSLGSGFRDYFSWEHASGVVPSGLQVAGPWATPPNVPWAADRVGNTVTMTLGPAIALNDGTANAIAIDFGVTFSGFLPIGTYQNGTLLIRDAGVDKIVSWYLVGTSGLSLSISNGLLSPPSDALFPFPSGSTGQTGFPNTVVLTWVCAEP